MEPCNPRQNQLLASLPDAEWHRWEPQLERVALSVGELLHESGARRTHVYFPTSAIVSLLHVMHNGSTAQIAVIGCEGLVGVCSYLGDGSMPSKAVVVSAGMAYRCPAEAFKDAFERSIPVRHQILSFTQALIAQMSQTGVCNRHHSLDQQLARWLLLSLDRLPDNEVLMTHGQISTMLGVRREGVTEAALKLQTAGLIRYARGHIWVLDRLGLEQFTCECYQVMKKEYDRLLPALETT